MLYVRLCSCVRVYVVVYLLFVCVRLATKPVHDMVAPPPKPVGNVPWGLFPPGPVGNVPWMLFPQDRSETFPLSSGPTPKAIPESD